jgi:hypothetical protein
VVSCVGGFLGDGTHDNAALQGHRGAVERKAQAVLVRPCRADLAPACSVTAVGDDIEAVGWCCALCVGGCGHDLLPFAIAASQSRGVMGSERRG